MLHFILILTCLTTANGIDPWETGDGIKKNENIGGCPSCPVPATKQCDSTVGDTFYRRLLSSVISSCKLQDKDDGIVEGAVHFEFPSSEFKILKELLSKSEPLTPPEYRRIDGIISENILKLSVAQQLAEKWTEVFVKWWEVYYIHISLLITFLICSYMVYHADWSRIPLKMVIFVTFCVITVAWEIMLALKDAELKDYKEFVKNSQSCSKSFWKFWEPDCQTDIKLTSYYWHCLHPLKIFGNICGKLIANIISPMFTLLNDFTTIISDKVPWGLNHAVYVGLNTLIMIIVIYLIFGIFFNIILNKPFTVDFFNFKLKFKENNDINRHTRNPLTQSAQDTISGENLKNLLSFVKDVNTEKTNINAVNSINAKSKKLCTFKIKNGINKTHRRVSRVPNQLCKLGGGDHL